MDGKRNKKLIYVNICTAAFGNLEMCEIPSFIIRERIREAAFLLIILLFIIYYYSMFI